MEARISIIIELKAGGTLRSVARKFNISHPAVRNLWKKFQETGSTENLKRTGRPPLLTDRDKRALCRQCLREPFQSAKSIYVHSNIETKVSACTVGRALRSCGLFSRRAVNKPLLTKCNVMKRKRWCKDYSSFSPIQWNQVIFSDECRLEMIPSRRRLVRRRRGTRLQNNLVCHTMKYGGYAIMIWGAIKGDGSRALVKCPIKLNSDGYQNVLEAGLVELYEDSNIFMQDNAPCHKSQSTLAYLDKKKVCLLSDWPPQSPDVNIIENLWSTLKRKVTERYPRNAGELWAFAKEEWDAIPNIAIQNLYASIPKRLQAIIKNNGRHCKY